MMTEENNNEQYRPLDDKLTKADNNQNTDYRPLEEKLEQAEVDSTSKQVELPVKVIGEDNEKFVLHFSLPDDPTIKEVVVGGLPEGAHVDGAEPKPDGSVYLSIEDLADFTLILPPKVDIDNIINISVPSTIDTVAHEFDTETLSGSDSSHNTYTNIQTKTYHIGSSNPGTGSPMLHPYNAYNGNTNLQSGPNNQNLGPAVSSLSGTTHGQTVEDSTQSVQGNLQIHTSHLAPSATAPTFQGSSLHGTYGTLTVSKNGHWTYQIDNSSNSVQALIEGQQVQEHFSVHSTDGKSIPLTIDISGKNDTAQIAGTDLGNVTEETTLHTTGQLTITDVDSGQARFSNTDYTGSLGTLHMTDSGTWTYNLDNNNPKVQALGLNQAATDTINIKSADGTTHQITININGTNDVAQIAGTSTGQVTEDKQVHTSGTLTISDVDSGQARFSNTDYTGALGTLHMTDSGSWTYDLDNKNPKVQALGLNQAATDTINIKSADGTTHQITININGTNDVAQIAGTSTGQVTEDKQGQTSGQLAVSDVDSGQAHFSNTNYSGTLGTLHMTDSGAWTYDLDNNNPKVQALGLNQAATDTINIKSADGTTHQITININGTNDVAQIAGTSTGQVTEDKQGQTSGQLAVSDVDSGQAHFSNTNYSGTLGTLHMTDSGAWTYDLDNNNPKVQALGLNQAATDTINIKSADGTTHQITININGTNDVAQIAGTSTGQVTEDKQVHTSGTLTISDVDTGEAHFSNTDYTGALGTLHMTDSGAWTYDLDNKNPKVQALTPGTSTTDTISVISADGTTHDITINIKGTNDQTVITGTDTGNIIEDHNVLPDSAHKIQVMGHLSATNPDHSAATNSWFGYEKVISDPFQGQLHVDHHGNWDYSLANGNSNVQALAAGESKDVIYEVHSADGTAHRITVTVTGTNDKPTVTASTITATEDIDHTFSTSEFGFKDVDHNDDLNHITITDLPDPAQGALTLNGHSLTQGQNISKADIPHLVFEPAQDFNGDASFKYTVNDGHVDSNEATAHLNFSPTDDATTMTGPDHADFTEDTNLSHILKELRTNWAPINLHDPDGTPAHIKGVEVNGQFHPWDSSGHANYIPGHIGSFEVGLIGSSGNQKNQWLYAVDNSDPKVQALAAGEQHQETMTIITNDGTRIPITVTITGKNDGVVLDSSSIGAMTEGGSSNIATGQLHAHDVDHGDTAHFEATTGQGLVGSYGHLTVDTQGHWQYTLNQNAAESIPGGSNRAEHFSIKALSTDGTTATRDLIFWVQGKNQTAHITDVQTDASKIAVKEDSNVDAQNHLNYQGHLNVTDVDELEHSFPSGPGYSPIQHSTSLGGTLSLRSNGEYTYSIDNNNPTIQALDSGQHLTDTVIVKSKDGTPHTINITINGTDDQTIITGTDTGNIKEDQNVLPDSAHDIQVMGYLSATNPNNSAATNSWFGYEKVISDPFQGQLHVDHHGNWDYSLANGNSNVQALAAGESKDVIYEVHSADGTAHRITVTVTGTNDKPTVTASTITATEDIDHTFSASEFGFSDIDHNDDLNHITITDLPDPTQGVLTLNGQSLTQGQNISKADISHLIFEPAHNFNGDASFKYTVNDGHTDSNEATATLSVANVGDAPELNDPNKPIDLGSTNEGSDKTFHATDLLNHVTDADGDTLTIKNISVDPQYGSLTDHHDGSYTFHPATNYHGSDVPLQFVATDGTHDVNGKASVDVIAASPTTHSTSFSTGDHHDTASITEDSDHEVNGFIDAHPSDGVDVDFAAKHIDGSFGSLDLKADGSWKYTLDQAKADHLNDGDLEHDIFKVSTTTGETHDIRLDVHGHTDAISATLPSPPITVVHDEAVNEFIDHVSVTIDDQDNTPQDVDSFMQHVDVTAHTDSQDGTSDVDSFTQDVDIQIPDTQQHDEVTKQALENLHHDHIHEAMDDHDPAHDLAAVDVDDAHDHNHNTDDQHDTDNHIVDEILDDDNFDDLTV